VVLVLLSQTAACLLYYGIKVAHMFMQHGLQRLPSVSDACQPALMALSAASDGLEQGGGGGEGVSAGGEHPKLALLRQLVMQRKAAKPVSVWAWRVLSCVGGLPHACMITKRMWRLLVGGSQARQCSRIFGPIQGASLSVSQHQHGPSTDRLLTQLSCCAYMCVLHTCVFFAAGPQAAAGV
jgi:hypothetical protein